MEAYFSNIADPRHPWKTVYKLFEIIQMTLAWLPQLPKWAGLKAIDKVRAVVASKGKTTEETRFFILTVTEVKTFTEAVRGYRKQPVLAPGCSI